MNLHGLKNRINPQTALDTMLGLDNELTEFQKITIDLLDEIKDQPFRAYTNEKLEELAKDIQQNGLLSPLIVRKINDRFQILAGRNRYNACKLINAKEIMCKVLDIDDNQANLILVNSNLNQRQQLLPSEKAFAYKLQLEAENSQGNRTDLQKDNFANNVSMVDFNELPFMCGVNLSCLPANEQQTLFGYITQKKLKIDLKLIEKIKQVTKEHHINIFQLEKIFFKPPKKPKKDIKIKFKSLEKYIDTSKNEKEIETYILNAIEFYKTHNNS